jgi:hypothetical protein
MRALVCIIVVILLAIAMRPVEAQVPTKQAELPPKLIEQMAALPAKLQEIDQSIKMGEAVDKSQYEEMDRLTDKIEKLEAKVSDLVTKSTQNSLQNKPVVEAPKPKVEQVLPKPSPVVTKSAPVVSNSGPVTNGTYYQADGYRSQWTYPGDIASHAASVHGISTAGKTKEQLEREHDMAHNGTRVTYAPVPAVVRSTVRYAPQTRSNCPGGVCPTQPAVRWNGILRRR